MQVGGCIIVFMPYFAEISPDNVVLRVLKIPYAQRHRGQEYLSSDLRFGGRWVLCEDSAPPAVGDIYNAELNCFIVQSDS